MSRPQKLSVAARIKRLRSDDQTQVSFAKELGVSRSLVAKCEAGRKPTRDMYMRLGNLAARRDELSEARWFWGKGGVDSEGLQKLGAQAFDERKRDVPSDQITSIHPLLEKWNPPGTTVPFARSRIPHELHTHYVHVPDGSMSPTFRPGDVLVIDAFETDLAKLDSDSFLAVWVQQAPGTSEGLSTGLAVGWLLKQPTGKGGWHFFLRYVEERKQSLGYVGGPDRQIYLGLTAHRNGKLEGLPKGLKILGRVIAWIAAPR